MSGLLPVYTVIGGLVMAVSVPIASLFSPVESTAPPVAAVEPPRVVVVSTDRTTTTTVIHVPIATPQPTATPQPIATPPRATTRKSGPMPYVTSKLGDHVP